MSLESLPEPSDAYIPPRIVERTALDLPLIGNQSGNQVCASFSSHPA